MRCTMTVYTTDFCEGQYYDLLAVLEMLPDYRNELITRDRWNIYADGSIAASIVVIELTPGFRFYWQFPKNDCVFPISNLI